VRSKGWINVAATAEQMGGGHKNAAGCTLTGSLAHVVSQIPELLHTEVGQAKPTGTIAE
jgi:nanoRNase/pAp phosphatase (c-di-AMP/oligoRNAs hydrolase)